MQRSSPSPQTARLVESPLTDLRQSKPQAGTLAEPGPELSYRRRRSATHEESRTEAEARATRQGFRLQVHVRRPTLYGQPVSAMACFFQGGTTSALGLKQTFK
ncbi:hypothetical protein E2320_010936 [Naja naja]|nr:hypothetical protein E2320_010936 [Naja naja]